MDAVEIVRAVLDASPSALAVSSLGTATSALRAASDDGPHLYMGGAMGSALAVAIGVAERRSDRAVVAFLGDGETLMGAGSLWTLAAIRPANLLTVILDDGRYAITGGQPLAAPARLAAVAVALGIAAREADTPAAVAAAVVELERPALLAVSCDGPRPGPSPFVDPPVVRFRFEQEARRSGAARSGDPRATTR